MSDPRALAPDSPPPEVTVVVPTRNAARTLAACLESLRAQTTPCRTVVVDNGSTDATVTIAEQGADVVLHAGPERSAQRNYGARAYPAAIVGFIDADMILAPSVVDVFLPDRIPPDPVEVSGEFATETCDSSIVVPFYNPGPRFGPHLVVHGEVLEASGPTFEVIAVPDGRTDGSEHVARNLDRRGARLIMMPCNGGKGCPVRAGMLEATDAYVGFIDADMALPPDVGPRQNPRDTLPDRGERASSDERMPCGSRRCGPPWELGLHRHRSPGYQ